MLRASRPVPTAVLVAVDSEQTRATAIEVAEQLRARGISTEVAPRADKYGRQIRYADRRGIPYVWFGGTVAGRSRTSGQASRSPQTHRLDAERGRPETVGRQSYAIKLRLRTARSIRFQAR